jgi:hypothetical protein
MSGGQHRDDEVIGPSRSGEVKRTEGHYKSREQINYAQLRRDTSVLGKQKINETFLTEPTSLEMFSTVIRKSAPSSDFERVTSESSVMTHAEAATATSLHR